jgi:hypothetical protein
MQESTKSKEALLPSNLKHDPLRLLDGMLVLKCFICERYKTPIEWDMENHLISTHRGYRVRSAIDTMKRKRMESFDHMTAKFSSD